MHLNLFGLSILTLVALVSTFPAADPPVLDTKVYRSLSAFTATKKDRPHAKQKRQNGVGANFIPLTLTAVAPGAPFHGQKINANNQKFVIGAATSSYCPYASTQPALCPPGVDTVIKVGNGEGDMYANLPGGQPIYIPTNTPYSNLSFSMPHLRPPATVASFTGFSFTPYPNTANRTTVWDPPVTNGTAVQGGSGYKVGTPGWFMWYSVQKWLACPAAGWFHLLKGNLGGNAYSNSTGDPAANVWTLLADIPTRPLSAAQRKGCLPLEVEGTVWGGNVGAWEYVKTK